MKACELSEEQFKEVLRLQRLYHSEAERCMKAKSYLAGCVMIGAALEVGLIGMCHCYSEEIPTKWTPKKRNGRPKHLLNWALSQLIRIARECNWLPYGLALDDDWNYKKAQIGEYAIVVKESRNLVHASRYIADFPRHRVTRRRMKMCFDVLDAASDHFLAKISESLKRAVDEKERTVSNQFGEQTPN
jgi:hypothetical protein